MAPEQVTGKPLDARADLFAFGCILYEAIAGRRAFEAESFVDTLYKIVHEDPAPFDAPPELERIVQRCLAKNRDERYQSIREVASDLRAWNAGVPPAAPAPSRRRLLHFALAAIIVLAITAFALLRPSAQQKIAEPTVRRITSDGRALHTAISPDGRYVAYVTSDARGATLSLEQLATGRTIVVVPACKSHYTGVTFSPDGEYLYFTRYDNSTLGTLYRVSILGGEPQPLLKDADTRPSLSPDGKLLAFARDDFNTGTTAVMLANADGTNVHALATFHLPDRLGAPAWSPDGDALVAARGAALTIVTSKGEARTIKTSAHLDGFRDVAWPARDRVIAAATTDDSAGRFRVWNIALPSGEATPITSDLADLRASSVSANGAIAALQVIRQANVFETDARGATMRQLTTGIDSANGLTGIDWLGERVVYASTADGKPDLWLMQAGDAPVRLTDDAAYESNPIAAPDGSQILYLASTARSHAIWSVRPDGTERRQVTGGPRDGDFAISPDSKRIAWASLDLQTNTWGLWTMPLSGGAKKRIATSASILEEIRYTPDGAWIVFTGYERSTLRIYRVPAVGGRAVALTSERAHEPSISPDGRTIACSYGFDESMESSLALIDIESGRVKTIDLKGSHYQWLPSGKAISYLRSEGDASDLWLQPLDGSAPRRLTRFNEGAIYDYAWNASGTRAVIAHVVDSSDVVLMK